MGFMVERVFKRAGASEEQKARAREIVRALGEDLKPFAGARREGREAMLEILAAETIDRARLESQRAKMIADAQTVSERVTRALADLAEVLTPEQRRTVAESLRRLRDERKEWMKDS
jgi:Spy/CpxP family protein refolding chaperone